MNENPNRNTYGLWRHLRPKTLLKLRSEKDRFFFTLLAISPIYSPRTTSANPELNAKQHCFSFTNHIFQEIQVTRPYGKSQRRNIMRQFTIAKRIFPSALPQSAQKTSWHKYFHRVFSLMLSFLLSQLAVYFRIPTRSSLSGMHFVLAFLVAKKARYSSCFFSCQTHKANFQRPWCKWNSLELWAIFLPFYQRLQC